MNNRKVGIIGVGHVGAHVAYSLAIQGIVDELVLADTDTARVESEYQDLLDALTIALPYIGYPRTLNGLSCVNAIAPSK